MKRLICSAAVASALLAVTAVPSWAASIPIIGYVCCKSLPTTMTFIRSSVHIDTRNCYHCRW